MKTIMIVPELPCKNCHKYEPNACVECFNKNGEKEQVPESWEELKSLCKDIKDIQIVSNVIYLEPEDLGRIELYSDGVIVCNEYILAENRTVAQMWNFIKSLMEKEDVLL